MTSYTPFSPRLVICLKTQWDSGGGEDIIRGRDRHQIVCVCIILTLCNLKYQCQYCCKRNNKNSLIRVQGLRLTINTCLCIYSVFLLLIAKLHVTSVVTQAAYSVIWVEEVGDTIIVSQLAKRKDRSIPFILLCQYANWGWNLEPRRNMHLVCGLQFGSEKSDLHSQILFYTFDFPSSYWVRSQFARLLQPFFQSSISLKFKCLHEPF